MCAHTYTQSKPDLYFMPLISEMIKLSLKLIKTTFCYPVHVRTFSKSKMLFPGDLANIYRWIFRKSVSSNIKSKCNLKNHIFEQRITKIEEFQMCSLVTVNFWKPSFKFSILAKSRSSHIFLKLSSLSFEVRSGTLWST